MPVDCIVAVHSRTIADDAFGLCTGTVYGKLNHSDRWVYRRELAEHWVVEGIFSFALGFPRVEMDIAVPLTAAAARSSRYWSPLSVSNVAEWSRRVGREEPGRKSGRPKHYMNDAAAIESGMQGCEVWSEHSAVMLYRFQPHAVGEDKSESSLKRHI